jgi:hypothetical protein
VLEESTKNADHTEIEDISAAAGLWRGMLLELQSCHPAAA